MPSRPRSRPARTGRLRLRYFGLANPHDPAVGVVRVDRRWYPMQRCHRDDVRGLWPCRPSAPPPSPEAVTPASTRLDVEGPRAARRLASSLALVEFDVPFMIDGVQGASFSGTGLVVDAEKGLVVVDRDTVPVPLGDLTVTFGGAVEVPAEVVLLHPDHNLAVLRYDPALLGDTPVRSAELRPEPLRQGEPVWLVAFTPRQQLVSRASEVARVEAVQVPLPRTPRFRETNVELAALTETADSVGGVLADDKGRVRAFWGSFSHDVRGKPSAFFAGLPAEIVAELVAPLRRGEPFVWHSLGAELETLTLAQARGRGLPEAAARRLEEHDPLHRQVLAVRRLAAGTPAAERLRVGDLLLSVSGAPVTRFREVERAAQDGDLDLAVLRGGEVRDVALPTVPLTGRGTDRVVAWSGALLQAPPRQLALQRGVTGEGVYVAGRWRGSPADRHGLLATRRITAVDGAPTPDLDAFLAAAGARRWRDSVRLRTVDLEGKVEVQTLELDLHYWPTYELRRVGPRWERTRLSEAVEATPGS